MSKSDPSIKINPHKSADLEFDVVVNGTDDNKPDVRFVIEDECCDRMYKCVKGETKNSWCAKLPVLTDLKKESYQFRVEIVVDGYFFTPAKGKLAMVQDPTVKFQAESARPSVTTSFTVKQEEDKPVEEASGGGTVTGQYAPTNDLLKPEYEPPSSHAKAPGTEKDDENIDMSRLSDLGRPVPGPSTDPEPEGSDTYEINMGFDPRDIAEKIIKDKMGSIKAPETKGSLFTRGADGKPIVDGIVTPEQARLRKEKSARVKEILKTT